MANLHNLGRGRSGRPTRRKVLISGASAALLLGRTSVSAWSQGSPATTNQRVRGVMTAWAAAQFGPLRPADRLGGADLSKKRPHPLGKIVRSRCQQLCPFGDV